MSGFAIFWFGNSYKWAQIASVLQAALIWWIIKVCYANRRQYLTRLMTKPTKRHVRPAKTQISLGIRLVWSESSLCANWVAKDLSFFPTDSEGSDQTGRMPRLRLIWVLAGRTCHFVGFVVLWLIFTLDFALRYIDKLWISRWVLSSTHLVSSWCWILIYMLAVLMHWLVWSMFMKCGRTEARVVYT